MKTETKFLLGLGGAFAVSGTVWGIRSHLQKRKTRLWLDCRPENIEDNLVKDKSIYGNDGLIVGAQPTSEGLSFGLPDYVLCGNPRSLILTGQPFSIEILAYPRSAPYWGTWMNRPWPEYPGWCFRWQWRRDLQYFKIMLISFDAEGKFVTANSISTSVIPLNQLSRFRYVFDGESIQFLINGELDVVQEFDPSGTPTFENDLCIGATPDTPEGVSFDGILKEIKIKAR